MSIEKIRELARKYALQNAIHFEGKADQKAVAGKVIAAFKNKDVSPKEIFRISGAVCLEVNSITLEKQKIELKKIAPELLLKEKKERDFSLPPLPHAEKGKVVTRFPPEPNGYLHIGHAKAAIIDKEYAQMYQGRFILRFDDTNPENAQLEFYDAQKEDLQWLGIEWDEEYNTSDHLETHYKFAEQLIKQGDAYICKCPPEVIKEGRFHSKSCSCRDRSCEESSDLWKDLISSGGSKGAILRLHAEMDSPNTAIRDPTLFRVIEKEHPIQGNKYRVWPTYDFAGAIEDSISGVTHPFRTKEYELRDPVYFRILSLLNLRRPHLMEFSRLAIKDMPVSKRKIKPFIEKGHVSGYDDVRLPTLQGLKRRGILPETIREFIFSQGISKAEATVDFSLVEAINRKILDPQVRRFFLVIDPMKLLVKNAPKKSINLPFHPTLDLGDRTIKTDNVFFVQKEDVNQMKKGDVFRLKGLYNVQIDKLADTIFGTYHGEKVHPNSLKIQWTTQDFIPVKLYVSGPLFKNNKFNPRSLIEFEGYAENAIADVNHGENIQLERIGFARIEKKNKNIIGYFSHK